ncbi:MAG: class I SAM-dependent methyltransferase [Candidatus Micrarchaeota archaeon]|nr:class I SAM-dependent methyltransferase [Candidatus Micrarchaeota archaeon]
MVHPKRNWREIQLKSFSENMKYLPNDERINKSRKLLEGDVVLDIGCGNCEFIKDFKAEKYGIDLNPAYKKICSSKNVRFISMNIDGKRLPFPGKSFDCIYAGEIIEHLFNYEYLISESYRVLKEGGALILTTPNLTSLQHRFNLLCGKHLFYMHPKLHPHHLRLFTKSELIEMLERNGFKVEKVRGNSIAFSYRKFPVLTPMFVRLADYYPSLANHLIIKARKVNSR